MHIEPSKTESINAERKTETIVIRIQNYCRF